MGTDVTPEQAYGHILKLIKNIQKAKREAVEANGKEDTALLAEALHNALEKAMRLGLPVDQVGYESEDNNPLKDLRE